ncbi:MAG: hypothetical protein ACTSU2_04330 [Promethearchaeota archaeon]
MSSDHPMLFMTPLYGVFLGFFITMFLMVGLIWFEKIKKPREKYNCPLILGLRGLLFSAFTYWGILMWDSVIKIAFFGGLSHGNLNFYLASLILMAVLGSLLIIGSVFTAPTLKTLIVFTFALIISIYQLDINPEIIFNQQERAILFSPIITIIEFQIIVEVLFDLLYYLLMKKNPLKIKPLWDMSDKFKKFMSWKIYLLLYILFSLEAILKMEGFSLLFWL